MLFWVAVAFITVVAYILYNRWSWIHSYWEFRGVPGPGPWPFVGNIPKELLGCKSFAQLCNHWCAEYKEKPLIGIYRFMTPYLIINKQDYVETVLDKSSNHFANVRKPKPFRVNLSDETLQRTTDDTWKYLRTKLGPIFSVDKVDGFIAQMKLGSDSTFNFIEENQSKDLTPAQIVDKYIIDVTAKVVYGIDASSSLMTEFVENCEKLQNKSCCSKLKSFIHFNFPKLANYLRIPYVASEQTGFFKRILDKAVRERKASGVKRNDIVQLLLELKENEQIQAENMDSAENQHLTLPHSISSGETPDNFEELVSTQGLMFLTIGLEAMSNSLTHTLVRLCSNAEIMDKVVKEVDSVMDKNGGISYTALKEMKYLEMCIMESLRLNPPTGVLNRCVTRNYTFDNGIQILKRMMVTVPIMRIHMDPNNYPQPEEFKPERFAQPPQPSTYLPFGDGPRSCIAKNFAMAEMKLFISRLLHKYKVKLSRRTVLPLSSDTRSLFSRPTSPVSFTMTARCLWREDVPPGTKYSLVM